MPRQGLRETLSAYGCGVRLDFWVRPFFTWMQPTLSDRGSVDSDAPFSDGIRKSANFEIWSRRQRLIWQFGKLSPSNPDTFRNSTNPSSLTPSTSPKIGVSTP